MQDWVFRLGSQHKKSCLLPFLFDSKISLHWTKNLKGLLNIRI